MSSESTWTSLRLARSSSEGTWTCLRLARLSRGGTCAGLRLQYQQTPSMRMGACDHFLELFHTVVSETYNTCTVLYINRSPFVSYSYNTIQYIRCSNHFFMQFHVVHDMYGNQSPYMYSASLQSVPPSLRLHKCSQLDFYVKSLLRLPMSRTFELITCM